MSQKVIPIILSADDTYAPYLGVTVLSIAENVLPDKVYKVVILDGGISATNKKRILSLSKRNLEIEFFDILTYLEGIDLSIFHLSCHFTLPTYFRFFIPEIFKNYDKVLYLDCDLVVLRDISPLLEYNLQNCYFAATRDFGSICFYSQNECFKTYCKDTLSLNNPNDYIQAGVMVFNIQKSLRDNLKNQLLQKLSAIRKPLYLDQDILNSVCQGKIQFIPQNWNYTWHLPFIDDDLWHHLPESYRVQYQSAKEDPYIIHFTGENMKPVDMPFEPESQIFWHYAAKSPYFEDLWKQMWRKQIQKFQFAQKNRWKLYRYWLLMKCSFGRFHQKYVHKYNILQKKIGVYLGKEVFPQ